MSLFKDLNTGDDHPDAAGKHLDDAEALWGANRLDGAAYHAGYVVECSLKSVVVLAGGSYKKIHDLRELSSEATRLAALPSGSAARYSPGIAVGHSLYDTVKGWKSTLRYKSPGLVAPGDRDWVDEARRVYGAAVARMRLDGVV